MKLKNRLIRIYLFSIVAILVLFFAASIHYLKNYDSPVDEYKMQKFADKIAGKIGEAGGPDEIKQIMDESKNDSGGFDFIFIDDSGSVVYSTDSSYSGHVAPSDLVSKLKFDETRVYGDPSTYRLYKYSPVTGKNKGVFILKYPMLLTSSISTSLPPDYLARIVGVIIFGFILMLLVPSVFFIRFTGNITGALDDLSEGVKKIEDGDFDINVEVKGDKEIKELAGAFNHMSHALREAREKQKAMERSRMELFSNISHDLKTPLSSIIGYAEGLKRGLYRQESEKAVDVIYKKALSMKDLISGIMELSKIESGEETFIFEQCDLAELLKDKLAEYVDEMDMNGIKLDADVPDGKCECMMDSKKIGRVLDNLLSNAVKYGKKGRYIKVELRQRQKECMVSIYNRGAEIKDFYRIFERFYREEQSRSSEYGGYGLGLAIAREIVLKHGGKIGAERQGDLNKVYFKLLVAHP